jgi:Bacterial archaeo-eukaryotic release factor family 3
MTLAPVLDQPTLDALLSEADLAVSIFLQIAPRGDDPHAPAVALNDLIRRAEAALDEGGQDPERRDAVIARAREAARGEDFARHREPGLALFLAPDQTRIVHLPEAPAEEGVTVGRFFYLKPLLPMLARDRRFNVLAVSTGKVRLFAATPYAWEELPLDALPPAVEADAIALEYAMEQGATPMTASPEGIRHNLVAERLGTVAYAVRKQLGDDPAPLILAAEPKVTGQFRKLAHNLRQLQEDGLQLNPFAFPESELHARAAALMRPVLDAELDAVLDRIEARLGSGESTVSARPDEVLAAAHQGRIEAVVVAGDEALWDRFDPAGGNVAVHSTQGRGDEDLLNEAAVVAMRHGGRAFAVPRERIPRRSLAAALLRY